jgi:flagellar biosynthetic protein FlhB
MADDKQEEPTAHKLSEARRKGQIPRSMDIVTAALLTAAVFATTLTIRQLLGQGVALVAWATSRMELEGDLRSKAGELTITLIPILLTFLAVGLGLACVVIGISLVQNGFNFSLVPLEPNFSKVNPLEGFKRLLSSRGLLDSLRNAVKAILVLIVAYFAVSKEVNNLGILSTLSAVDAYEWYLPIATRIAYKILAVLIILAAADIAWQRYQFTKSMRMSKQEIVDEHKMLEGDPKVKARVRRFGRQMIRKLRVEGVKDARVVITNPTHYAVALAYREGEIDIPLVVAKGKGFRAQVIKGIAKRHNIHIIESPPLARALYKKVGVGKFIPPSLYLAVAEILVMVQKLEGKFAQNSAK